MKPKFRLVSDGKHTYMELDGKTIGTGVQRFCVEQQGTDMQLDLSIDLGSFEFMEDGKLDDVAEKMKEVGKNPFEMM